MPKARGGPCGAFTLIELMLVVAIISLLAAIAIPKFSNLIIKAKEAGVKAHLGTLRSTMSIYYADNEGYTPHSLYGWPLLNELLLPKYIAEIPSISIPTVSESIHPKINGSASMLELDDYSGGAEGLAPWGMIWVPDGAGAFFYTGKIGINCTHPDSTGRIWSTW